jgi:hypothetical protein
LMDLFTGMNPLTIFLTGLWNIGEDLDNIEDYYKLNITMTPLIS